MAFFLEDAHEGANGGFGGGVGEGGDNFGGGGGAAGEGDVHDLSFATAEAVGGGFGHVLDPVSGEDAAIVCVKCQYFNLPAALAKIEC